MFKCNIKLVHQTINKISPLALQESLNFKVLSHAYQTRNMNLKLLERPKAKTLIWLKVRKIQIDVNLEPTIIALKRRPKFTVSVFT